MTSDLDRLAEACGIVSSYVSEQGETRHIPAETKRKLLELMGVDPAEGAPAGLSRWWKAAPDPSEKCHVPSFLRRGRCWGVTCQLYGLRSQRNWGIGDFEDLAQLAEILAAEGADFLGVNPLHALYPADPERCSPYSPSSRRFLNVLYIAPDLEPEFEAARDLLSGLGDLRRTELVPYREVASVKFAALERMSQAFRTNGTDERRAGFQAFRDQMGEALDRHCLFEALHEHFAAAPWWEWPEDYRRPTGAAVRQFRAEHAERVDFFAWLQWLAAGQLARAQEHARAAGMRIGLYLDLAVGVAPDGAMTWADPDLMVRGAHIGAPPDAFNASGQDWGLVPQRPTVLIERNLAPFHDDLQASMRHAGAVRLDHAMALQRLYWLPAGETPLDGGYVQYPFAGLLAATAAESRRWQSLVIGEALGTVPERYVRDLGEAEVHAYRVLIFEQRRDSGFRRPRSYPRRALGCLSTHDLPTLAGWWQGRDIDWRLKVGFMTGEEAGDQRSIRNRQREALWQALISEDLLPAGPAPEKLSENAVVAAHRYMAGSPVRLMGVQLEDAVGEEEQPNLPGASDPHPNWRRNLSVGLEHLAGHSLFRAVCRAMAEARPRP